jgi:hypothetical protein
MNAQAIPGAKKITISNYKATHGCAAFKTYVGELGAEFLERKDSGVYVIGCTRQTMLGIAAFAGFDALPVAPNTWVVRRALGVSVVEAAC